MTTYQSPTEAVRVSGSNIYIEALPEPDYSDIVCPNCGADSSHTTAVWESVADYYACCEPDYIGCHQCREVTNPTEHGDNPPRLFTAEETPGLRSSHSELEWGDIVDIEYTDLDKEQVVVSTPKVNCHSWAYRPWYSQTVADRNPDFPPTDPVVITAPLEEIREQYPYFIGAEPISLADIDSSYYYPHPESRLTKIGRVEPTIRHISNVVPSPYHLETFSVEENAEFIEEIQETGLNHPPKARNLGDTYRLVNGHKRAWTQAVLGKEEIELQIIECSDKRETDLWAKNHFDEYSAERQEIALRRIVSRLGDDALDLKHIDVSQPDVSENVADSSNTTNHVYQAGDVVIRAD